MTCNSLDMTLHEVMADAVIGAALRADRIDPQRFEALLRGAARDLQASRPTPSPLAAWARRCRTAALGIVQPW